MPIRVDPWAKLTVESFNAAKVTQSGVNIRIPGNFKMTGKYGIMSPTIPLQVFNLMRMFKEKFLNKHSGTFFRGPKDQGLTNISRIVTKETRKIFGSKISATQFRGTVATDALQRNVSDKIYSQSIQHFVSTAMKHYTSIMPGTNYFFQGNDYIN